MKTNSGWLRLAVLAAVSVFATVALRAGTFASDFASGPPAGGSLYGSAVVEDGVLKLTPAVNYRSGSFILNDLDGGGFVKAFTATFKLRIGGGTGADGFSFAFGPLIPDGAFGMEGTSDRGLVISFDTYNNGGGEAPAIDVFRGGFVIASYKTDVLALMRTDALQEVRVVVDAEGRLSLTVAGTPVFTGLRGAFVPMPGRFAFGAATGGANDNHWVDDIQITTTPATVGDLFAIEAEMFDTQGGGSVAAVSTMPYGGNEYAGLPAIHEVDYRQDSIQNEQNNYRTTESPNVPLLADVGVAPWMARPGFVVTTNHRLGWTGAGEWYHFSRTLAAGYYRVALAASHSGTGSADIRGRFHLLADGKGTNQPRLWDLGAYSGYGTGAWARNHFVTLKRAGGTDAVIGLPGGAVTLRLAPESGDGDWFMLIPVSAPPAEADLLVRAQGGIDAGTGIYQILPSGSQVVDALAEPLAPLRHEVRVVNRSAAAKALTVKMLESAGTGWTVRCEAGGVDVKAALGSAAGYSTAVLDPGASETLSVETTADLSLLPGTLKSLTFAVFDGTEVVTPRDSVRIDAALPHLTTGRQGLAFAVQAPGPEGSTYAAEGLPGGLEIDPVTGRISGTPAAAGTYDVRVVATHAGGATRKTLRIVVGRPVPVDGLVDAWLAEGNALDSTGPNPGTAINGVAYQRSPLGLGFLLDGSDDYIDVGPWFNLQAFTMAFWVRPETSQNTYADIMDNNHTGSRSWVIQYSNVADAVGTQWTWGFAGLGSVGFRLAHQTWQHLAFSVDPVAGGRCYLNGKLIGTLPAGTIGYDGTQFLSFGRWRSGGRHFRGGLDDILLYNRALSADEVAMVVASAAPLPAAGAPDLTVRGSGAELGLGIYEYLATPAQTAGAAANPLTAALFEVKVRNDDARARAFVLRSATDLSSAWTARAQNGGDDITPELFSNNGYPTGMLEPGQSMVIALQMTPNRLVPVGQLKAVDLILLPGEGGTVPLDCVRAEATVVGYQQPDLLVSRSGEAMESGDNLYHATALGQQRRTRVDAGATASYQVRVTNDGNAAEAFRLKGGGAPADWTASYWYSDRFATFDGNDDHIATGAWGPGTQWTIEAWARPTALPTGRHSIAGGYADGRDWGITLQEGRFGVSFKPASGGTTLTGLAPGPAVVGEWMHVAGTCDGTTARLYLNGAEVASGLVQVGYVGTTAGMRIGGEVWSGANGFPGQIRDVRVWNRARSQAELSAAMNGPLTGGEEGLLGWWPMEEGTGTVVADRGPNLRQGTFGNGTQWQLTSVDVTSAVTSVGGFQTRPLAPADSAGRMLEVRVTPSTSVADGASADLLVGVHPLAGGVAVDAVRVITHASGPAVGGVPVSASYTSDADFEFGQLYGVENQSAANQLQLSTVPITLPYIFVPNSNEGTISKVDTRDGRELGRYRVCPASLYGNPSRTTIDQHGNCWVGNRRTGTVVKVGLIENGQWIDHNQNGVVDTSADLNNDGVITGAELLDWGKDECVLFETILIPGKEGAFAPGAYTGGYANDDLNPGPRSLAVDAVGNLWVGSWGLRKFHYLNGQTGVVERAVDVSSVNHTPYGALIDGRGIVWSSSQDKKHVLWLDPATDTFGIVPLSTQLYGLGIDANDHLFVSGWQSSKLYRVNTLTRTLDWTRPGAYESRGVAVTADGDVWTADTSPNTVSRYSNNGALKATLAVGAAPTGVAVDAAGKVWVVHNNDESIRRIDPSTNTVDLVKNLPGTRHYGYSDMTGIVSRNATVRAGYWSVVHDSKVAHSVWTRADWTAQVPEGTSLRVLVRSSDDGLVWSPWEEAVDGMDLAATPPGRYLEIKAEFSAPVGLASPVLEDVAVTAVAAVDTDLVVTKKSLTETPRAEHVQSYQVDIRNAGEGWASNVVLTDTLPAGFEFQSISIPGGGYQLNGGVLTARYAGIAPGAVVSFVVTGIPWTPGDNTNAAVVVADRPDLHPADNQVTLVTPVAALECAPVPPGMLAWWPGNGSTEERVAGRNLGDLNGAGFATARVGQGFSLDGNDDYLELAQAGMIHSDRGLTVTGWFRAVGYHRTWQCIYYKGLPADSGSSNDNRQSALFLNSAGYLHFCSTPVDRIGVGQYTLNTGNVIQPGAWYHFAAVADCDRGVMEVWLNGVRVAQGAYPMTAVRSVTGPFRIGTNGAGGEMFRGSIDEVAVFGRGLSGGEIGALYDVRSAGYCHARPFVTAPESLPVARAGIPYAQQMHAALGTPPYEWELAGGTLPAGVQLSPSGLLAGTAQVAGTYGIRVRVTDAASAATERDDVLQVVATVDPLAATSALWPGEGNGDDVVGSSHGRPGGKVYYVPGVSGRAFAFVDDAQSDVTFPNTPAVQVPAVDPQFTIDAWIKPNFGVTGNKLDTILSKRDGCGAYAYQLGVMKGYGGFPIGMVYLDMQGMPGSTLYSDTLIPDDGRFHHVAATYKYDKDVDNVVLYLDGEVVGTRTGKFTPPATSAGPVAGRHAGCGYYSSALIDEIAIHQVELTPEQIEDRYLHGAAGTSDPLDADLSVKLAAEGAGAWLTEGLREVVPPSVQVKSVSVAPAVAADFEVRVVNATGVARSYVLRAVESGTDGWSRSYQGPSGDVTAAIKGSGGYATAELAPGGAEVLRVRFTPGTSASGGQTLTSTVSVHRDGVAVGARDAVRMEATCLGTALTDMLVRRASDAGFMGDNIRNLDGSGQGKTTEIAPGQSALFYVRVANDGNVPTQFRMRTVAPGGGWTLQCSGPTPALSFDGVNDYIKVPDAPALRPASLTVEGWFQPSVTSGSRAMVAKGFGTQDWDSYVMWIENGTLYAGVMNAAGRMDRLSYSWNSLPAGWHHVAMTFDSQANDLRLFIDGVERGRMASEIDIVYDAHPLTIGCDTVGTNFPYPFGGQVRDVRLWNVARTPAEVAAGMDGPPAAGASGLVAAWPLTDGAGLIAADLTGRHPGELVNGTAWWFIGSADLTAQVTSPDGWAGVVLSPGQSYDLGVTLKADSGVVAGARCDVLVEGGNVSGDPLTHDVVRVAAQIGADVGDKPQWGMFTTNEDFDQGTGTLVGVEFGTVADQLQLGRSFSTLPFLWVPNSNQGTISKVDTRTGMELGRYRVCPDGVYGNPSRTTVDLNGNCWVGNRRTGTAVKVGLLESGGHVDRNGDGIIQTSRDLNGNGVIDAAEVLAWGADECVLLEVVVIPGKEGVFVPGTYTAGYANDDWNPGPRGIAIDAAGDLWLGSFGLRKYHKINGSTGEILRAIDVSSVNHTPYGAVIDRNGIIWSSGSDKNHVLRLDPLSETWQVIALGHYSYGLGLDNNGHLFVSGWENSKLTRIDIGTGVKDWTLNGVYQSRGVAVTADGDVWTANSGPGTVTRFSNDGAIKATVEVGNTPTGVAVDADGKVWVVNNGDEYVKRIDPATNAVDLARALPSGTNHYGYSDMTGIVARNATTRFGTWTVTHDSRFAGTHWERIGWTSLEPGGQGLAISVRTSGDGLNWSAWTPVLNGAALVGLPAGRYIQISARFQVVSTAGGEVSPVLYDLYVTPMGGGPVLRIAMGSGGKVVLTGEGSPDGWILERSSDLRQGAWEEVPFTATVVPGGFTIEQVPGLARMFYRLRHK